MAAAVKNYAYEVPAKDGKKSWQNNQLARLFLKTVKKLHRSIGRKSNVDFSRFDV